MYTYHLSFAISIVVVITYLILAALLTFTCENMLITASILGLITFVACSMLLLTCKVSIDTSQPDAYKVDFI